MSLFFLARVRLLARFINPMMKFGPICLWISAFFFLAAGCAPRHADVALSPASPAGSKTLLVKTVEYDPHGRPFFSAFLQSRPSSDGDQFTAVEYREGKPVQSVDIIVSGRNADLTRPFEVVYKWTGEGFQAGMLISEGIVPENFSGSAQDAAVYLAVKAAPVVIGGISGFVVGLVASIPETAVELRHLVVGAHETATSFTRYEYDLLGRLTTMRMFVPQNDREVVKTAFSYHGNEGDPYKTEVTSYVENKVRTIR
jgi:YD repeat-containing protein